MCHSRCAFINIFSSEENVYSFHCGHEQCLLQIAPGSLDLSEVIELVLLEGLRGNSADYSSECCLDDWELCVYDLIHAHLMDSIF